MVRSAGGGPATTWSGATRRGGPPTARGSNPPRVSSPEDAVFAQPAAHPTRPTDRLHSANNRRDPKPRSHARTCRESGASSRYVDQLHTEAVSGPVLEDVHVHDEIASSLLLGPEVDQAAPTI